MIRTICESLDFESVVVTQIDSYRQVPVRGAGADLPQIHDPSGGRDIFH